MPADTARLRALLAMTTRYTLATEVVTALPALLDELDALRGERDTYAGALRRIGQHHGGSEDWTIAQTVSAALGVGTREDRRLLEAARAEAGELRDRIALLESGGARLRAEAEAAGEERERARCIAVARGCADYSGGHRGEALDAYRHGFDTVVRALSAPPSEMQTRVLEALGRGDFEAAHDIERGEHVAGEVDDGE